MKIKMVGTGSMISKRNPASYLINDKVMIDMPNGIVKILKNVDLFEKVEYVFITHMHGDHIFDLPFLFLDRCKSNKKLTVVLSKRWYRKLKKLVKLAFPRDYYNIFYNSQISFVSNKNTILIDDLYVERMLVKHGAMKPSYGYIIKERDKTVVFTGDSGMCENIWQIASQADAMVCDCTLSVGNEKHMGVNDVEKIVKSNKKLKVFPSHTSINANEKLKKFNYDNLYVKEDMEEIII